MTKFTAQESGYEIIRNCNIIHVSNTSVSKTEKQNN